MKLFLEIKNTSRKVFIKKIIGVIQIEKTDYKNKYSTFYGLFDV